MQVKSKARPIQSVLLFYNERKPEARKALRAVRAWLRAAGVRVWMGAGLKDRIRRCDIAMALGGDGTMLRASRMLAPYSVPLLGVNTGGLGFLSGVDIAGLRKNLRRILRREFAVSERGLVSVELRRRGRRVFGPVTALNDCVVRCSDHARAVMLKAFSSDKYVATYFGDGLAVSTPTGSTAYALAVGGPVVAPSLDALLLAPISPHTLTQRPLILPAADPIVVRVVRRNPQDDPHALVSLDGQLSHPLRAGDDVIIRRYGKPFRILLDPKRSYFELLRHKLKWGER